MDAKHEHDRARRRALLSDKSPKVIRGGYTVAEQTAWVITGLLELGTNARKRRQQKLVAVPSMTMHGVIRPR